MPPSEKPYHHGNLPQALIDAAIALLAEEGLAALSLRKVAARVGVSHGSNVRETILTASAETREPPQVVPELSVAARPLGR